MASTRPRHRGNTGGGKPPPPTVTPVKYSGSVAVLGWIAQKLRAFQEGVRAEMAEEEARAVTSRAFSANRRTLNMVPSFKYLSRVILVADVD